MRRHRVALLLASLVVSSFVMGVLVQRYGGGARFRARALGPLAPAATGDRESVGAALPDRLHGTLSLFILAGQSNMSGRGAVPGAQTVHPAIFTFGNDYRWKPSREPVDDPAGQVDRVSVDGRDDPAGFGPALSFALALVERRGDLAIGLIPCAKGDTTIHEWQRSLSDATLYGSCLKRIRAASLAGTISGLLFFQGEADARTPGRNRHRVLTVDRYAARFADVVTDLRRDLSMPRLPVVFAQIGTHQAPLAFANWQRIREQQSAVRLTCSAMIATADLPLRDEVHFTTDAYLAIGRRFAAAYLDLIESAACRS